MRLPVPHLKQTQQADCLAACAAMVLAYLNQPTDYRRLLTLLGIGVHGAPGAILYVCRVGDWMLSTAKAISHSWSPLSTKAIRSSLLSIPVN